MLALLTGLLLAQLNPQPVEPLRVAGRCNYPPAVIAEVDDATLVQCGKAVLSEDGIAFASRGFEPSIRFVGEWGGANRRSSSSVIWGERRKAPPRSR